MSLSWDWIAIVNQVAQVTEGFGPFTPGWLPGWPVPDIFAFMRTRIGWAVFVISLLAFSALQWARTSAQALHDTGWPTYGSDPGGTRYSAAAQIDRSNVQNLKVAWTYRTGASEVATKLIRKAAFEATPILAGGKLYLSTPYNHVIALEPGTGAKLWEYDPGVNLERNYSEVTSRGVSAWRDQRGKPGTPCSLRIFVGTLDARLIALDGETGKPCADFGANGSIDLNEDAATQTEWTGGYQVTSPPAIYRDLVIVGSSIADNWRVDTGRGIVRAFDARSGKLRWTWDPIPWAEQHAAAHRSR